jgi:Fe-S cluster assembly scaffold protein SufB
MSGLRVVEKPQSVIEDRSPDGISLSVPDQGLADRAAHVAMGSGKGKLVVHAGVSSRFRLAVSFGEDAGLAEESEADFEFYLEPGACVDVFFLSPGNQRLDKILSKCLYHLKKHASLNVWTLVGDSRAQWSHELFFDGPHGFASMRGLSLLGGLSDVDHRVHADHATGSCISRQFYKSIVAEEAKTSFSSLVSVERGADKSDSKQLNKNLLLSKTARAVSRPELRIAADDVTCAHGSATGEIDPAQFFYLRSRGISKEQARFMMIEGFAAEVLNDIPDIPFQNRIREWASGRVRQLAGG